MKADFGNGKVLRRFFLESVILNVMGSDYDGQLMKGCSVSVRVKNVRDHTIVNVVVRKNVIMSREE